MDLSVWLAIYIVCYIICLLSYRYMEDEVPPIAYFAMLFVAPLVPFLIIGVAVGKFIKAGNPSGDDE